MLDMTTTSIIMPTIVNIREAALIASDYPAVITAGPQPSEVRFGHPNHFVRSFSDTTSGYGTPTVDHVEDILDFAEANMDGPILVHCHAGISRSTATAWGIAILRGEEPFEAFDILAKNHPARRSFHPNPTIVRHLEDIFMLDGLVRYAEKNSQAHYGWSS